LLEVLHIFLHLKQDRGRVCTLPLFLILVRGYEGSLIDTNQG
jgi:hypothetical protein